MDRRSFLRGLAVAPVAVPAAMAIAETVKAEPPVVPIPQREWLTEALDKKYTTMPIQAVPGWYKDYCRKLLASGALRK